MNETSAFRTRIPFDLYVALVLTGGFGVLFAWHFSWLVLLLLFGVWYFLLSTTLTMQLSGDRLIIRSFLNRKIEKDVAVTEIAELYLHRMRRSPLQLNFLLNDSRKRFMIASAGLSSYELKKLVAYLEAKEVKVVLQKNVKL